MASNIGKEKELLEIRGKLDMDDPRFRIRPYQQIASSCTGGIITSLFMTPLDVVKTRLQVQHRNLLSSKCYVYCNGLMDHICPCNGNMKSQLKLNGTIDAFVKISRYEGVKSLWSGLSPTLVLALPTTIIYFVGYEQLRVRLKDVYIKNRARDTAIPFWIPLISGGTARILAVTVVNPLELIRTKMQSQHLNYYQVGNALKQLVAVEGARGLWKGWTPTLFRDVPFSAIYWTSYETIKSYFNIVNPSFTFSFCCGAAAGSIAALITTPFDVVKTHKQIELGEQIIGSNKPTVPTTSTLSALLSLFRKSGIQGIFAGLIPRLAKVAPACAIMIGTFEYGKSFFYEYNVSKYRGTSNSTKPLMVNY